METNPTRILLVEDNPGDARLIREMLSETGHGGFEIERVSQLSQAQERLAQGGIDLIILDLGLPDSQGLETFVRAYDYGSDLPFVVLTGLEDETVGMAAISRGAQDYLVKGKVDSQLLSRAIRYAIERRRSQDVLLAERLRLFNLLDTLPAVVYAKAPNCAIRFANRRFEDLFGSWEGKRCYEAIHGRMASCEGCTPSEILQTQKCQIQEMTWNNKRTYQTYHYPFNDIDGSPLIFTLGMDITERKQAEKALQRQKEELQIILDSVPAMIFYKDTKNRFVRVNKALAEVSGLEAEEIEGKTASEVFQGRNYYNDDLEVITSGNPKKNIIEPLQTPAGKRWAQTDKMPYRDERGDITGVIGFALDITERLKAEEALRESQKDLNRAQAVAKTGSWRLNVWRNELLWSDETYRIFGIPLGRPMTYEAFLNAVHPGDREYVERKWQAALGGGPYDIHHRIVVGDRVKWVRELAELEFDSEGMLLGGFGTVQDITERKQAETAIKEREDQLATIYENAPLIMVLVDSDRRVRRMNKLAEQFAGAEAAELIGRYGGEALGCLHALDDPEGCGFGRHCQQCTVRLTVLDTLATGRSHHQVEACLPFSIQGKDQEVTFLLCTANIQVQGHPQVLVTIQDISERKRMEEAQKDSEGKLRLLTGQLLTAQEDERRRLSQGLHDELGHALLAMKLDLGAMGKQLLPEQHGLAENVSEIMGYVDEVVENVRRLYLDLTPGDLEDLGLTAALKNLCEEFGRHHERISWSMHLENIDDLLPIRVQTVIYRIFQEILTNIGKHADPTRVSVMVKQSDNRAIFEVKDNGRGFDVQAGKHHSPERGMGLLAMGERVRMLGGDLRVWSRLGQGTKIAFASPLEHNIVVPEEAD